MMRLLLLSVILTVLSCGSVCATPLVQPAGVDQTTPASTINPLPVAMSGVATVGSITNTTTTIPGSSTGVTLAAASTNVSIFVAPGSSNLYVDLAGGTASTADFEIPAGYAFTFTGLPAITTFKVIGDGTIGTYSVFAH